MPLRNQQINRCTVGEREREREGGRETEREIVSCIKRSMLQIRKVFNLDRDPDYKGK